MVTAGHGEDEGTIATAESTPSHLVAGTLATRESAPPAPWPSTLLVSLHAILLVTAAIFFALHFVHITADFPNFSRWMDWSKYTDEGWYGDAAIRHYQLGHWYVPGDFNPAVALPVWPLLEALVFRFTGVSLIAVRALTVVVFGGILVCSWLLIARSRNRGLAPSLAGSIAVLLLAVSPFCYVFTRLGILEPLLILLMLLALLAAQSARESATFTANLIPILALGILLPLLILTKTTGLFLVPAIAWMLFATLGHRIKPFLWIGLPAAGIALALWLAYFVLLVRPHYLTDYRYLFSANAYTSITLSNYRTVLWNTIKDGRWFGTILQYSAAIAMLFAAFRWRRLREHPMIPVLMLWALGYTAFLAYHNNLQPRYYLVVAVPLTLLLPVVIRDLILPATRFRTFATVAAAILFAAIAIPDARVTIDILRHPQYTLLDTARKIDRYILDDQKHDPSHSALLLSISGSDLSLMTGLHSICDDFGTAELVDRVNQYRPGWYASWNLIEDDKMDALTPNFNVERVATFPAMDDQDRNLLILYRLTPADAETDSARKKGRRRLRSKLGQQPSTTQLKH